MFFEQFMKLCDEKGVKPTPILKELKVSTANLKRWREEPEGITLKNLKKIADYFKVPISYLLGEENKNMNVHQENVKNENTNICYNQNTKTEENGVLSEIIKQSKELDEIGRIETLKYIYEYKKHMSQNK